ncbi:dihydrofolate reductase family protein [Polymorphospora rubra]|uniref:dihydrofolate reductase family protein n=1 Tax=Polymorphospora rubra TaxID=338584 RepID=UPI0033C814AF
MRVVAQQWVSVDGYAAGPRGEQDIFAAVRPGADAASQRWNDRLLDEVDSVLLGRRSYGAFSQFWPTSDEPIAERVNRIDKVVFSRTLDAAPWGTYEPATIVADAVSHVRERRRDGDDATLLLWGSLAVMHGLMAARELDEFDLFVAPVALGAGTPLVPEGMTLQLTQVGQEIWDGAAHLRYTIDR